MNGVGSRLAALRRVRPGSGKLRPVYKDNLLTMYQVQLWRSDLYFTPDSTHISLRMASSQVSTTYQCAWKQSWQHTPSTFNFTQFTGLHFSLSCIYYGPTSYRHNLCPTSLIDSAALFSKQTNIVWPAVVVVGKLCRYNQGLHFICSDVLQ